MSASSLAFQICPVFSVGVLVMNIFLLWNVLVRSLARLTGSASFLDAPGYLSTSSRNRNRIALLARLDGEFEPASVRYIPSNCNSCNCEFSSNLFRSSGAALNIGCSLFSDMDLASVSVGYTIMVGAGSCWTMYPTMFWRHSVPPTCVGFT